MPKQNHQDNLNQILASLRRMKGFGDPSAPAAEGPDAELFRLYAEYIAAEASAIETQTTHEEAKYRFKEMLRGEIEPEAYAARYKAAGIGRMKAASDRARSAQVKLWKQFRAVPAYTMAGVLLKLEFGLSAADPELVPLHHDEWLIYSAIVDLRRMIAAGGELSFPPAAILEAAE
jgi:hypothetical protein